MKERPILFSGPMVRALLDGRKTQTRRVVKPQPVSNGYEFRAATGEILCHCDYLPPDCLVQPPHYDHPFRDRPERMCPYGEPGDRLWVRETWAGHESDDDVSPKSIPAAWSSPPVWYAATETDHRGRGRWRPSIHMPRWASRITLAVTSVRVKRLQDVTEDDARAEGVTPLPFGRGVQTYRDAFAGLWDVINGARAPWASNLWVWVIGVRQFDGEAGR